MAYKQSKQRQMILEHMNKMETHISAEELFKKINETEKISLATIYRNLNILVDMNEIKKIALEDGYVYDKTCTPHYHFYCNSCLNLFDISLNALSLNDKVNERFIHEIEGHDITFNGTCKNCKDTKINGGN